LAIIHLALYESCIIVGNARFFVKLSFRLRYLFMVATYGNEKLILDEVDTNL